MSDIIGFLFGFISGGGFVIILLSDYIQNERKNNTECRVHKNDLGKQKVVNPYKNCVFYGYQPEGTV